MIDAGLLPDFVDVIEREEDVSGKVVVGVPPRVVARNVPAAIVTQGASRLAVALGLQSSPSTRCILGDFPLLRAGHVVRPSNGERQYSVSQVERHPNDASVEFQVATLVLDQATARS